MPGKHHGISPDQTFLPIEPPAVYGPEGSYVDLAVRAEYLIEALNAIGQRNQRLGFDTASNARQYSRPIRERYRGALVAVQVGARDNEENFLDDAKQNLWQATGYIALRGTRPRLAPKKEIDSGARKMWRDFEAEYGHTSSRQQRNRHKRLLQSSLKRLNGPVTEEAAEPYPQDFHIL